MAHRIDASLLVSLTALACAACTASHEAATSASDALTDAPCSVARGAFVPKTSASPSGDLAVQCVGASNITLNGDAVTADNSGSFTVKPRDGVNILHVEQNVANSTRVSDVPFLFGTFGDPSALVPGAITVRVGAAGMSSGHGVVLPLPAGPTPLDVSTIATQVLRDQGNLLAAFDGTTVDASGLGFDASITAENPSYDPRSVVVVATPRAGGVHLDVTVASVSTTIAWQAGLVDLSLFHDDIGATIGRLHASVDVDLRYEAHTKSIRATLGAHQVDVDSVTLDSAALDRIPLGLGAGLEGALSDAAQDLINTFADPLVQAVQDQLVPKLEVAFSALHLPSQVNVPLLGGPVDIAESFDGAKFQGNGLELALGAQVAAHTDAKHIAAPGYWTHPSTAATLDPAAAFAASVSTDYVNEALFAFWKQGLFDRQVSGPVSQFGVSTDAIVADAKMPPIVFPHPNGHGLMVQLGELELTTVYHSTSSGDAKVRLAVSIIAGANMELSPGGDTLVLKPNGDDAGTTLVANVLQVLDGQQAAADELTGLLTQFTPYLQSLVADDLALPPIALPALDLGKVTPGFAGRKGTFDGALQFDPAAARIGVAGKLMAR